MSDTSFDLIVIGGGPGGYVAAIRAAQLGMSVACVERRATLGGTCLNVGCIPSKALLHSSELFEHAGHGLAAHGIKVKAPVLDLVAMQARKEKVVADLTKGIDFLFRKNKVARFSGSGRIPEPGTVEVTSGDGDPQSLSARHIIIATGSEVTPLPGIEIDEKTIVSSTGALALEKVPGHLVVVGAGYIGLELGSVWRRLGARVTVVEFLDRITPGMDGELSTALQRTLARQGMEFRLGTKVTGAKTGKAGATLTLEPAGGGTPETLKADTVLVSIGRRPFVDGLGLEAIGVARDPRGYVVVDARFRTSVPGIYAIGDAIPGPMLAHKAEEDGVACVEGLAGGAVHVDYGLVPGVIYTAPEAATVGRTEESLKDAGVDYVVGKFPFTANSRARATGDTDGFVKILADARTDRVLGVHVIGPDAGTLIHEAVTAMVYGASAEDIARTCHAHPTLAEAVKEAALDALGRAVHS
jgi:dihydrolipoamide dehydrogenase